MPVSPPQGCVLCRRPFLWGAMGSGVLLLLWLGLAGGFHRGPLLPVTLPKDPSILDSEVRAYVLELASEVTAHPRDSEKRATLGLAYAANGLWNEARQTFQEVARLDPGQPLAPLYAAVCLQEHSDDVGALREFQAVTAAFPGFAPGWYRVGEASLRVGDLAGAETAFTQLVRLAPGEWRGPAGLGEVCLRQAKAAAAIPFLEQAIGLDRTARPAQYLLGQAYRGVGRTNEARLALALGAGEARQPMPDAWSLEAPRHMRTLPDQLVQADELSAQGRPDLAIGLLRRALNHHPNHAGLLNQLAVAFNRAGQPAQGLPLLDQLLKENPKSVAARLTRSYAYVQLGLKDPGLADAREAVAAAPRMAQAHLAVANALLAMERDHEALAELAEALQCDLKNAEIHVEMGDVLWRNLGENTSALDHFQQALELNPALAKAYSHLGLLQLELGQLAAARKQAESLRALAPGSPELAELEEALRH